MKHLIKIVSVLLLVFAGFACTDLDENLRSDFTESFDPNNPGYGASENVNRPVPNDGLNAAFSTLLPGTANHSTYFTVSEIPTDEMVITQKGGDWFDGGIWLNMHRHDFRPTNPGLDAAWGGNYGGINQANELLAGGGLDANQTAQLRVLRAYYYWRLMDMFGRVKIITQPGVDSPQVDRPEIYDFVVTEILDALPDLNETAGYARVSSGAAYALLSRLYLNAEVYNRPYPYTPGTGTHTVGSQNYQDAMQAAIDAADEVIDSGVYDLGPQGDFDSVYGPANVGSVEHIWIVPFDEATGTGMNFGQMTFHYPSQLTYDFQQQPWNGYSSLEAFYDSYDDNDLRKDAYFVEGPQFDQSGNPVLDVAFDPADPDGAPVNYTPEINELAPNGSRQAGVRLGKFSHKIGQLPEMDNDFPLLRYGEVLMNKAEAIARRDDNWGNAETTALVNQIRQRAEATQYGVGELTEEEFLAERGREFFQESLRRTDLIRFDAWGDAWWEKDAHSLDYKNIMPIPQPQINATTDGSLTQHADY
jgi:hypothetical protein